MPGGRGGRRQGTPGKGYTNRTDLANDYAQSSPAATPASAGAGTQGAPRTTPEDLPKLDDPSAYPQRPVTDGLTNGPGQGPQAIPMPPADDSINALRAAYYANPTPQLERVLRVVALRNGQL